MTSSIVEVIQHYQRSIDNSQDNEPRLLHCINKLYKLPIKVEHLQETGVGKTVNSLRKFNGEIGVAAKTLVTKWKAMVAAEEEPMDTNENESRSSTNDDGSGANQRNGNGNGNLYRNSPAQKHEPKKYSNLDNNDEYKGKPKSPISNTNNINSASFDTHKIKKESKTSDEKVKSASPKSSKEHKKTSGDRKHKEREKESIDHKRDTDKHKRRKHEKDKAVINNQNNEKSKLSAERTMESPSSNYSVQSKSNSNKTISKSKHEDKGSHSASTQQKHHSDKYKNSSKNEERIKDTSLSKKKSFVPSASSKNQSEHKSSSKDSDSVQYKRRHNSENDSIDFKSPDPKMAKLHKNSNSIVVPTADFASQILPAEKEETDGSFDSSMGANFDDVLGMLNMPVKKNKKYTKSLSTATTSGNSTSKKECFNQRQSTSANGGKVNDTIMKFTSNLSASDSTPSTSKTSGGKLDLLASNTKLEPLDPSIVLELPTISTNYKPMPLNQTVMDCVFNNSLSSTKPARTLSDAEAITHGISSKTMRTKIYSGVRTGQTFQVPSLFDMCIRLLQKNIDALEYTGGVPFEVLKPVLERATPQQLYIFEEYNPYLMEDSDVLWQQHVSRNYRTKKRIENESWREMFIRCQEEEERKLSVLKDSIKASQKIASAPVRKTQLAFIDSMVKPPRNVIKQQEHFGTKTKLVATPAARVASLSSMTPNAVKAGDHRLKVPTGVRDYAQVSSSSIRPKKAPLMQKTLQFIRGRHKR